MQEQVEGAVPDLCERSAIAEQESDATDIGRRTMDLRLELDATRRAVPINQGAYGKAPKLALLTKKFSV